MKEMIQELLRKGGTFYITVLSGVFFIVIAGIYVKLQLDDLRMLFDYLDNDLSKLKQKEQKRGK